MAGCSGAGLALGDLATETVESVLMNLPASDICSRVRATARRFNEISFNDAFWHKYLRVGGVFASQLTV